MDTLFVGNDAVVEVEGLQDANGDYVNSAVVEATLYESDGQTEVGGVAWPLQLTYQGGRGNYAADLPGSVDVADRGRYKLHLSAVSVGKRYAVTRVVVAETRYA